MKLENIFEKIVSDNKKIALVIVFSFIIAYLDYNFVLQAQLQSNKLLHSKIIKIKKDMEKLGKDLSQMQALKNEQAKMGKEAFARVKKFIFLEELPQLLKEISDIANKNQVRIMQIRPTKEPKDKKSSQAQNFVAELISLDTVCNYHRFGSFLNDLENSKNFLIVEELKISANPNNYFNQDIKLVLKTYVKE